MMTLPRNYSTRSIAMTSKVRFYSVLSLTVCGIMLLSAATVFFVNQPTRIVSQLEVTVSRIPIGIDARQADSLMGTSPDAVSQMDTGHSSGDDEPKIGVDGVLVDSGDDESKSIPEGKINISFGSSSKAAIITPSEQRKNENYIELIMPVRVG